MTEKRRQNHYNKIDNLWQELKPNAHNCPCCDNDNLILNESFTRKINRFYIECDNCFFCSRSKPTINMAIDSWNKAQPPFYKQYR